MTPWRPGRRTTDSAPPPLPVLPRSPAVRGYPELAAALRELGFRHAADVLRPPGAARAGGAFAGTLPGAAADDGFRILDGLWFPARGNLWRRVDAAYVRDAGARWRAERDDPRAALAASVADTLESVQRHDAMGVRRIVLWQLACLLTDGAEGPTAEAAAALGVHRGEAGPLADAVAAGFPPPGRARTAGETIGSLWPGDRLRAALRLARDIDPAGDWLLEGLLADLRARDTELDRLTARARLLDAGSDRRARAAAWFGALRLAADDDTVLTGLLAASAALAADPATPADATVRAEPTAAVPTGAPTDPDPATDATEPTTVRLTWHPARRHTADVRYRVLRFPADRPDQAVEIRAADAACTALDVDVPRGEPLHYAVVPLRGDRVAGVPRTAAAPLVLAPDVTHARVAPVPGGVRMRWRADAAAVEFRAVRTARGAGTRAVGVACGRGGLVERELPPGTYDYVISCGYRDRAGRTAWSAGLRVTAVVVRWPSPVTELAVRAAGPGGALDITWPAPEHGSAHLVRWPAAVAPGTDLSGRAAALVPVRSAALPGPGGRVRVTAVSVLGDLAVAGASAVLEHHEAVTELAVRRVDDGHAEVAFRWPEPAVLVLLRWRASDGNAADFGELRLSRSRLAAAPARFPVTRAAYEVTVTPLPRPDAVAHPAEPARTVLPAAPAPPTAGFLPVPGRWLPWDVRAGRWARWHRWRSWWRTRRT